MGIDKEGGFPKMIILVAANCTVSVTKDARDAQITRRGHI